MNKSSLLSDISKTTDWWRSKNSNGGKNGAKIIKSLYTGLYKKRKVYILRKRVSVGLDRQTTIHLYTSMVVLLTLSSSVLT